MKKIFFYFFYRTKIVQRKYYATGLGTLFVNLLFKKIFRLYNVDFLVHFTSRLNSPKKIFISNWDTNTSVHLSFATSSGCYYQAKNGIFFGNNTIWAPNVMFVSANHDYRDIEKSVYNEPIHIGDSVWIGANVVILPNVKIGNYCVIGAGSIVTKSFPDYCIIAGNPAKIIGARCKKCLSKIPKDSNYCSACKS